MLLYLRGCVKETAFFEAFLGIYSKDLDLAIDGIYGRKLVSSTLLFHFGQW